jgi:hypothetical protein
MTKNNQLSVLIPDRSFDTSIGAVTLKPFKFKQFKTALAIIEKYLKIILGKEDVTSGDIIESLLEKAEDDYTVLSDIAQLLGLVSSKETTELEELGYDEIFALLTEVVEQNMDFFGRIGNKISPQTEVTENELATTGELESPA